MSHQYVLTKFARYIPLWRQKIPKYPLYQEGNPQLRLCLPLFWMKMMRPEHKLPPGYVRFQVHPQMTIYDVKNYLEKIYDIPVLNVRTVLLDGKEKKHIQRDFVIDHEDDQRFAFVQLENGAEFEFPDLFTKPTEEAKTAEDFRKMEKAYTKLDRKQPAHSDVPFWFR